MSDLLRQVIDVWWNAAGLHGPFTPGYLSGNNDGMVRDNDGNVVADCRGVEARADVIAAALNSVYRDKTLAKAEARED